MGYYCTVPQCTSLAGKTKNVKFHRFPRDVTMADKWNLILKRGKPYTKYSKVCSLHFTQADYNVTTMGQWKTLSKDAVPSQNLPKLHADGTVMVIRKSRTVKYREAKKDDAEKDKWMISSVLQSAIPPASVPDAQPTAAELHDNLNYRLQSNTAMAGVPQGGKPRKQDAIMQTDPVQSEDDSQESQREYPYPKLTESFELKKYDAPKDYTKTEEDFIPQTNEEYNTGAEKYALERKSHGYEKTGFEKTMDYQKQNNFEKAMDYQKQNGFEKTMDYQKQNGFEKTMDFQKQNNFEKALDYQKPNNFEKTIDYQKQNGFEKTIDYQKPNNFDKTIDYQKQNGFEKTIDYQKPNNFDKTIDYQKQNGFEKTIDYQKQNNFEKTIDYQKPNGFEKSMEYQKQAVDGYKMDAYSSFSDKTYANRPEGWFPSSYQDSVELLRNQQHNLQILQEQHRIAENQNFFNENHIKQEVDLNNDEEKFGYERTKELDANVMYEGQRRPLAQHVKQEPDATPGCDTVLQPQGSPYYPDSHTPAGGYYAESRPGPELLIAKQNALAAHTQLWQNTMKRPFFYSENTHYNTSPLLHRYEDISRILQ